MSSVQEQRQPKFGDPRLLERFWGKVSIDPSGCWVWTAAKDCNGYGRFYADGRQRMAHRIAYESLVGQIPAGLEPDHLCRNRACVNPDHLEPVTHAENHRRRIQPKADGPRLDRRVPRLFTAKAEARRKYERAYRESERLRRQSALDAYIAQQISEFGSEVQQ